MPNSQPSSDPEPVCTDQSLLDYLRRSQSATISDLVEFAGVTATAIRQRINRMMEQGLLEREAVSSGRGRPSHSYRLSAAGLRAVGDNYRDLAQLLWSEIRNLEDPVVRQGLLKCLAERMAAKYRDQVRGDNLGDKMESLVGLMREREIPFEVQDSPSGELPVLAALACPYPDLADEDRVICSLEKMLFAEILGDGVRLEDCRLDGDSYCTFASQTPPTESS